MALFGTLKNPKGPDMTKLESFSISLSGTKIEFSAPVSNSPISQDIYKPGPFNLYDDSLYDVMEERVQPAPVFGCFLRWWKFKGFPLIHSDVGSLNLHIVVAMQDEFSNLFRPRRAEKAVERYIYTHHGPAAGIFSLKCRTDWRIIENADCTWMNYRNVEQGVEYSHWHLPLTEKHMLIIELEVRRYHDKANLAQCFSDFEKAVMSTFKISYSDSSLQAKQEASSESLDERFSETLPPLIWEEKRVEDEFGAFRRILEENMSRYHQLKNPDGTIDPTKDKNFDKEIESLVQSSLKKQKEELDEKIRDVLGSHLKFD